jgi:hypothetical protein
VSQLSDAAHDCPSCFQTRRRAPSIRSRKNAGPWPPPPPGRERGFPEVGGARARAASS